MKKFKWYLILVNLIGLLFYINYAVGQKEELLKHGNLILLELAPVDPRSLMQGDYMTLNYNYPEDTTENVMPKRGYYVVHVDKHHVATGIRFQPAATPLDAGEKIIKYTSANSWRKNIGAESYFFQEGQGEKFEKAIYGGIKIDDQGNSLLIGLYDANRKLIQ